MLLTSTDVIKGTEFNSLGNCSSNLLFYVRYFQNDLVAIDTTFAFTFHKSPGFQV